MSINVFISLTNAKTQSHRFAVQTEKQGLETENLDLK
jgi:hypothetical protein